ncbi:kinase family protein [Arabidopsis lyrata subsp. lyrata]|uniref:Kinase family protein n=1 Tax=Arabidopsis lyrata subsp. lyrata TaxID=81972 RepID=D7MT59_ARALL|nr:probable serine/threonine-protein kinase PBL5 [Arabidopsis lyrata subsp. lyrata]XP_002866366.1 probable serine/threonine-protein kinase PBL5 [Arabidopsis lyrata subsp. lyrata]EFH39216.1 kinase family protein [Arabidopsis lyrata subsp. lyrata]EFH42625.1 kinase family protein [Arabidopsis lyrata subsp. lyrata]|eukprot:XP_002862957.1 probable serine/threonine-protein kinase PBL5 [Arabidopsis lyrata subsp. lyrata]
MSNRFICCFGGGSSSKVVQDPSELPQQQPQESPDPSDSSDTSEQPNSQPHSSGGSGDDEAPSTGVKFRWREIEDGTENFGITHLIGQGNYGKVYRCNFPRIHKVGAAKIHNNNITAALSEFIAETTTLYAADHPNVIKLLGKYFGIQKSVLVYEFMPNGSLDHHLFAQARQVQGLTKPTRVLDWNTRMRIAVGVAEGLVYVHQGLYAIHRDVKVENILLDNNFVPKLSDFGFATKIVYNSNGVERQREFNSSGTQGYIAPEAEEFGLISTKSDIYSYGVFLLVLLTGRKAYDMKRPVAKEKLTDWLMPVWTRLEYAPMVVDVALGNKYSVEGLNRLFQTARMCINAQALERPAMDFVETMVREAAAFPVLPEETPVTERCSTST